MPTRLPSGLLIFNATPHELRFFCGDKIVNAPSDEVINALVVSSEVARLQHYKLLTMQYHPSEGGKGIIRRVRQEFPTALIVGSVIAAHAYPGEVVACKLEAPSRYLNKTRLVKSDQFIVHQENRNG